MTHTQDPASSQIWIVDQITEQSASLEIDGASHTTVPLWLLPKDVHEGDVLRVLRDQQDDRSILTISKDAAERLRRLAHSQEQVATVSKNDHPGNIVL